MEVKSRAWSQILRRAEPTSDPAKIVSLPQSMDQVAQRIRKLNGEEVHWQAEIARLDGDWERFKIEFGEERRAMVEKRDAITARKRSEQEQLAAMVVDLGIKTEVP